MLLSIGRRKERKERQEGREGTGGWDSWSKQWSWMGEKQNLLTPHHSRPRKTSNILNKSLFYYYDYSPPNNVPIFGPITYLKQSKYSKHHQNVILSTHQSHLIKIYAMFLDRNVFCT